MAGITNVDEVAKEITQVLGDGFRLDPGDFLLKNQIKLSVQSSDSFQNLPNIMKKAFQVGAEMPGTLPIADWDVLKSVKQIADAFNVDQTTYLRWSDRIVATSDRYTRVGLVQKMWDEFAGVDTKTYARALKRKEKYFRPGEGYGKTAIMAPDAETGAEISVRDTAEELAKLNGKVDIETRRLALLEQMQLENAADDVTLSAAEVQVANLRRSYDNGLDYLKLEEEDLKRAADVVSPKSIKAEAKRLRDLDIVPSREIEIRQWIHDRGGFSYVRSNADTAISPKEIRAIMGGTWRENASMSMWKEPAHIPGMTELVKTSEHRLVETADTVADGLIGSRPDLASFAGITDGDSLMEFLKRSAGRKKGQAKISDYMGEAEKSVYRDQLDEFGDISARQEAFDEALKALDDQKALIDGYEKALANGMSYKPFEMPAEAPGMLAPSKRAQEMERIAAKKAGLLKAIGELNSAGLSRVSVPLHPGQMVQYFHPEVPLDMITAEYSGVVGRALDSIQRGVVVKSHGKAGKIGAPLAQGTAALAIADQAAVNEDMSSEEAWAIRLAAFAGVGAIGLRQAMRYAKNATGPEEWIKITPNIDYLTALWKRYALGSVGVMFRIAGDEPMRMASRGFGSDVFRAWSKNPKIQQEMMKEGWYMGPYSYEKGMTQLAYLFNNRVPSSFIVFEPTNAGWQKAFTQTTHILQGQQTTRFWTDALKAGEDGKIGLARWAEAHPDTAASLAKSRGTSIETWIDQENEFLAKFTHRRVKTTGEMGVLKDTKLAEWTAYKESTGPVPKWYRPQIDMVLKQGGTDDLVHLRRDADLYGFLSGKVKLTEENIAKLTMDRRPFISARREKGALMDADGVAESRNVAMGMVDKVYDGLYGRFDSMMKNVRSNIYLREYKREAENLRRLIKERNAGGAAIGLDEDMLHRMADKKAQSMVDFMTYNSQRTGLENLLRDVVPFAPATRDFLSFWAQEGMRRPTRLASYLRLSTELPEEVRIQYDEDTLFGLGRILEAITDSNEVSFNPRALSFFTGGATTPTTGEGNALWGMVEQQFPGFGPFVTMPAHYLASDHPDQFGLWPSFWGLENADLSKIPGMSLVAKNIPLFSRTERFVWAATAAIGTALHAFGADTTGYDLAQGLLGDIPWLGRDKETRDRMVDLAMRWVLAEEGMEGRDIGSLTEDEQVKLLEKAKSLIVSREGATGFLGFVMPAIPYFKDREEQDLNTALGGYKDTYNTWVTPTETKDGALKAGWQTGARVQAQNDQAKIRAKYPEYGYFFDYIDGLAQADEEKILEVGQLHPEVISYFVSIYNNHGEADDYVGLDNTGGDSWESWAAARALGLKPVKDPNMLMSELANKLAVVKEFNNTTVSWKTFEAVMAASGLKKGDLEYETQREEFKNQLETGSLRKDPTAAYYKLGWLTPQQMGIEESPEEIEWKTQKTEMLLGEFDEAVAGLSSSDPARAMIKAEFVERFTEEGLDVKLLTTSRTEHLPAALRRQNEAMADIKQSPYGFLREDFIAHGIPYNAELKTNMAQQLDARGQVVQIVAANGGNIWNKKYDSLRAGYQEYVRNLADGNAAFAAFWDYYQSQQWERMNKSGRYTTEAWQDWFDALSQRDYLIDQIEEDGVVSMSDPAKKVKGLVDGLWDYAEKLKAKDPAFAEEFDSISKSFWDKERRW
jgi:hypothetical protein